MSNCRGASCSPGHHKVPGEGSGQVSGHISPGDKAKVSTCKAHLESQQALVAGDRQSNPPEQPC